jgi:hypothetical protein
MYVYDILAISIDATVILKSMEGDDVKYENDKIEPPEMYLGAKLKEKIHNGCKWKLPSKAIALMTSAFVPESDGTLELDQVTRDFSSN